MVERGPLGCLSLRDVGEAASLKAFVKLHFFEGVFVIAGADPGMRYPPIGGSGRPRERPTLKRGTEEKGRQVVDCGGDLSGQTRYLQTSYILLQNQHCDNHMRA